MRNRNWYQQKDLEKNEFTRCMRRILYLKKLKLSHSPISSLSICRIAVIAIFDYILELNNIEIKHFLLSNKQGKSAINYFNSALNFILLNLARNSTSIFFLSLEEFAITLVGTSWGDRKKDCWWLEAG